MNAYSSECSSFPKKLHENSGIRIQRHRTDMSLYIYEHHKMAGS